MRGIRSSAWHERGVEERFRKRQDQVREESKRKYPFRLNKDSEIIINHKTSETNVEGVYAAGDVADKQFKQAITGVAEGCTAAYSAFEYIAHQD